MTTRNLPTIFAGTVLLGAALALAAWPEEPRTAATARSSVTPVSVAAVSRTAPTRAVTLAGVVRATHRAELSFTVPGRLVRRPVRVGDTVVAGQLVAALDRRQAEHARDAAASALAEIEVRLAQAEKDLARVERLASAAAATAEEVEKVATAASALAAARRSARVGLAEAERQLTETALEAPFTGVVTAVALEPGEWAAPGRPVVELAGQGGLEVEVEAPETLVAGLVAGRRVRVRLPLTGVETGATVRSWATAARGSGYPVLVELDQAPAALAGMAAEVIVETASAPALAVPVEAVVNPGSSRPTVFAVGDGTVREVAVELGPFVGDRVIIAADLAAGDEVVVAGHSQLVHGDRVEVRR